VTEGPLPIQVLAAIDDAALKAQALSARDKEQTPVPDPASDPMFWQMSVGAGFPELTRRQRV